MTELSASLGEGAPPHGAHKDAHSRSPAPNSSHITDGRPTFSRSPNSNPNFMSLPPLTTALPRPRPTSRVPSFVGKRLSTLSNVSGRLPQSRPQSTLAPIPHSSLSYALVRDFAYDPSNILHYGPTQEPLSAASTTASEFSRRLSDTNAVALQSSKTPWSGHPKDAETQFYSGQQLPAMAYGDGPPWMEDEDLLSPIVTSSRHRKTQSDVDYFSLRNRDSGTEVRQASPEDDDEDQRYYDDHDEEGHDGDGAANEGSTFPPGPHSAHPPPPRKGSVFRLPPQQATPPDHTRSSSLQVIGNDSDDSRYSRDYSFSIASPDEEMHGKAIALFDFESENNNELPLVEGQVLWISYRHGQGWLVAKDPSTGEDGLVPEAYVRLEREIQGGFGGLNGQVQVPAEDTSPVRPETPRLSSPFAQNKSPEVSGSPGSNAVPQYPVVSHFTTSSKDLLPQHARSPHTSTMPSISPSSQLAETTLAEEIDNASPDTPQQKTKIENV